MYAIIKTGGKQYRVAKDQIIDVELLNGEAGSDVEFSEVLFVNDGSTVKMGAPHVDKGRVVAELLGTVRGPKITSMKFKRRKGQRTRWGHRQNYSRVRIKEIVS